MGKLSSKHQIIDIFERVFFRHTPTIFRHVARYNPQNELRLTKKYATQKVSIIQCLLLMASIFNEEYRQKMFVFIRHRLFKMV